MNKFANELIEELKKIMGEEYSMSISQDVKENDTVLDVLVFESNKGVHCFKLGIMHYYFLHQMGVNINTIAEKIIDENHQSITRELFEKIAKMGNMDEYEKIKDKLVIKLINTDLNRIYLRDKVSIPFLDLSAVFCVFLEEKDSMQKTITVTEKLFSKWKISKEQMYREVLENMQKNFPEEITLLADYLADELEERERTQSMDTLFVMQQPLEKCGGALMLYKDALRKFALEKGVKRVAIYPSSIQEILLEAVYSDDFDYAHREEIVRSINQRFVSEDEVLSNHMYFYDLEQNEVKMCKGE